VQRSPVESTSRSTNLAENDRKCHGGRTQAGGILSSTKKYADLRQNSPVTLSFGPDPVGDEVQRVLEVLDSATEAVDGLGSLHVDLEEETGRRA
jgi:hypothetical protein